jgi:phosphonopyruvate decarboxylase
MSINPLKFYNELIEQGIDFFTGVPDSLLKEFCLCIDNNMPKNKHLIASNEGNAIAIAAGHFLATKSIPVVYMQNSGIGNAINPLLSLCDPDVYSIPMLIIIGWRGEPGVKDEPQHIKQGNIQIKLMETLGIPYEILSNKDNYYREKIANCVNSAKIQNRPTILLVKKGTFEKGIVDKKEVNKALMKREEALEIILDHMDSDSIIVSTTGKTSREIFEIREKNNDTHEKDFLTVGSMGHSSSIALGIALSKPNRNIFCIDGDGSMLMHLGSLASIASLKPKNFRHILLNNEVHESVGGQDTAAKYLDLSKIVKAMGIRNVYKVNTSEMLTDNIKKIILCSDSAFLEVKIQPGSRENLGRPTIKPIDNKDSFIRFLEK